MTTLLSRRIWRVVFEVDGERHEVVLASDSFKRLHRLAELYALEEYPDGFLRFQVCGAREEGRVVIGCDDLDIVAVAS